jgi:hypothetical protein
VEPRALLMVRSRPRLRFVYQQERAALRFTRSQMHEVPVSHDPKAPDKAVDTWEARAWSCHATTTIGRVVSGTWQPVAECSGFGWSPDEAENTAALIVAALNAQNNS